MAAGSLRLTLTPEATETFSGFVSRLAARNGLNTMRNFLEDMRISPSSVRNGNQHAVESIAALAGCSPEALAGGVVRIVGDERFLNGQRLARPCLNRQTHRVCPLCVEEDLARPRPPRELPGVGVWQRIHWHIPQIRCCPFHLVPVVAAAWDRNLDFSSAMRPHLRSTVDAGRKTEPVPSARGDAYLTKRLSGAKGPAWLDSLEFHVAARALDAVGLVAAFGRKATFASLSDRDLIKASDVAYGIMEGGPDALGRMFDDLARTFEWTDDGDKAPAVYGTLFEWLSRGAPHPDFDPLRDVMRDAILRTFPVAAGEKVLGRVLEVRRLHTVQTASVEHRRHPQTIRRILRAGGIAVSDSAEGRTTLETFSAEDAARLIAASERSLSMLEVQDRLSINITAARALVTMKLLLPVERRRTNERTTFSIDDVELLANRLFEGVPSIEALGNGFVDLAEAIRRTKRPWTEIIDLVVKRKVPVALIGAIRRFDHIAVLYAAVLALTRESSPKRIGIQKAADLLRTRYSVVSALVDQGRLASSVAPNPYTRLPTRSVPADALKDFDAAYVGPSKAAAIIGVRSLVVTRRLQAEGVAPVFKIGRLDTPWFDRASVEAVASRRKSLT